ncbi:MAG: hypothetical protein RLY82_559, partial [Pseudomonadota bacterium]
MKTLIKIVSVCGLLFAFMPAVAQFAAARQQAEKILKEDQK